MSYNSLINKVVVVTGGSGGIGSSIVNKLSHHGAKVISVYYKNYPDDRLLENVFCMKANLEKPEDWERMLSFTFHKFGRIDVIINSAGVLAPGNFLSVTEDQIKKMIEINFSSVLIGIHKTLALMKNQGFGHIINIGSLGGVVPMPYSSVYSATKFALRGFSFALAEELKGTGIRLSLITPGSIVTKMLDVEAMDNDTAISFVSKPINPAEVANAVLKVIRKPKIELIIPRSQSIPAKLYTLSPMIFSKLYKLLHKIGILRKKSYLNRYCTFTRVKGVLR